MAGMVQEPEKELRFTRSGQAAVFWLAAAVLAAGGITLLATAIYRDINPRLPHPAWAVVPFAFAGLMVQTAVRLTKHAYMILTPLGIEIFPFFRPSAGMRLVTWQEIHSAEVDAGERRLTLHHDAGKTAGIHLALGPIRKEKRTLLAKAVTGRVSPPGNNG
ncbi:MAG: hypothetical protein EOP85_06645 [Verrucomicrobiaceae bacterium]|nr:MAG: hypothetical protein EOP85_06645 [Verrucomicrobiaceae bacterium]